MLQLYSFVFLLQAFCLYHAYKNNADQKWLWVIVIIPLLGSMLYLLDSFYNRDHVETVTENVKETTSSNYVPPKMEQETDFVDTVANKTKLADEYTNKKKYERAIALYESCLEGFNKDDPQLLMKLLKANYLNNAYEEAVRIGEQLKPDRFFQNTTEKVAYAISLQKTGALELAEQAFKEMDIRFTNYQHRIEYGNFLLKTNRPQDAKAKFATLLEELNHMDEPEKRMKRDIFKEVKALYDKM